VQAEPELNMSAFFLLTVSIIALVMAPLLIRHLWVQIKWDEYCLQQRKERDRKVAEASREAKPA
jgi:hypothetical protein